MFAHIVKNCFLKHEATYIVQNKNKLLQAHYKYHKLWEYNDLLNTTTNEYNNQFPQYLYKITI